jgi:CelD/BcsL family acetyltransferase involved in cellulose biosynthesis
LVLRGKTIEALGTPRSDYNDLLCLPEDAAFVVEAALRTLIREMAGRWIELRVENVPERSSLAIGLESLPPELKRRVCVEPGPPCSGIVFEGNEDFVRRRVLGNEHLRRKEKGLRRFGELWFEHVTQRREIERLLPEFFRQHIQRQALAGRVSAFEVESSRTFYRSLVEELSPDSVLRFGVLRAGERIAAFHFGFEIDGKYVCYTPTFDVELARWSPGQVLFLRIFEYVAQRGLRECDFTIGDEAYKSRFANKLSHNSIVHFFPRRASAAIRMWTLRAKESVKRQPVVYAWLRKMRAFAFELGRKPRRLLLYV